jgi:predicted dehydrogenase
MRAIENGKHILIEKPVVAQLDQLAELKKAGAAKNVCIFPAHNFVYRQSVIEAKKIITAGGIGKITYASFMSTHTISAEHAAGWRSKLAIGGGGALMDSGHHLVYMSLFFMGMPAKLQAFQSNLILHNMEGEDIAQVNLLYSDGAIGNLMQSWTSEFEHGINGVKFIGDKGCIAITDALYFNSEKLVADVSYDGTFFNQAKAFTDCLLKGEKPLSTLEDAGNALRIVSGAYESSETNGVKIFS